ncbi:MAG: hypothetical protein HZA17_13895, partial [Nitrospirae bacterium]|nr:hypothetical protein [Nitrospirota bacterium]
QVFWNLTDSFSLYGHLYTEAGIMKEPALANYVDLNHNRISSEAGEPYIKPYDMAYRISYYGDDSSQPIDSAAFSLTPGRYARLITLVDRQKDNHVRMSWTESIGTPEDTHAFVFEGTRYQYDKKDNIFWTTPQIKTFRGIRELFWAGVLRCTPMATDPVTGNQYCPYQESEAIKPPVLTPVSVTMLFQ